MSAGVWLLIKFNEGRRPRDVRGLPWPWIEICSFAHVAFGLKSTVCGGFIHLRHMTAMDGVETQVDPQKADVCALCCREHPGRAVCGL